MTDATTAVRSRRKTRTGKVVSDRMDKTVVVSIERLVQHTTVGRYVRRRVDQLCLTRYQLASQPGQVPMAVVGVNPIINDGLSLYPTKLAHCCEERLERDILVRARAWRQYTDAPHVAGPGLRPKG